MVFLRWSVSTRSGDVYLCIILYNFYIKDKDQWKTMESVLAHYFWRISACENDLFFHTVWISKLNVGGAIIDSAYQWKLMYTMSEELKCYQKTYRTSLISNF